MSELILHNFGFNLKIGKFVSQALCLYAERLPLLLSDLDLLFEHHPSFYSNIIF